MSTNIRIFGKRDIIVVKTGASDVQFIYFNAWQTPTNDSYAIQDAGENWIQAYIDWVMNRSEDEIEDVYFGSTPEYWENPNAYTLEDHDRVVGTKVVNYGKEHVGSLRKWIEESEAEGYVIDFEVI